MPCQILAPTLDEIARENRTLITIFKVNTDQFPQISEAFGATGIPFVVFIKNKKAIYALMGVQSKDSYQKIINTFADTSSNFKAKPNNKGPDGHRIKSGKSSGIHYQTKSPIHDPCYFII
jgi:thioredoxin-like negative regulator of GroEL